MKKINAGFTLVEVIVSMFIFTVIILALTLLMTTYFRNYTFSTEANESIGIAQTTLTKMLRDIREIRPAANGAWPIINALDNSFSFYSDVTNDGKSDAVRYFLDGTNLKRGIIEPSGVPIIYVPANEQITIVATNISPAPKKIFTYYNGSWPGDTVNNPLILSQRIANTKFVHVYLKVNIISTGGSNPFELESGVNIRSLKDNL